MAKEMVHHPDHYQGKGGLEVWQVQEAFTADLKGVIAGDACALIKYACRWPKKNGVEDLKKIIEYANHLIQKLEEEKPAGTSNPNVNLAVLDVEIPSIAGAENILRQLKKIIDYHGRVTVEDFFDLVEVRSPIVDADKYGWTDLSEARVIPTSHGNYCFELPEVHQFTHFIKEKESN